MACEINWEFTNLCDTDKLWGIILLACVGLGLLITLIFTIVFSANLKRYIRHEKHNHSTILYFVLVGVFLLFAFSITFIIKPTRVICILRRVGIGLAWTITLSPLLVATTRKWRMSYLDEIRCGWMAFAVCCFVTVEGIIIAQWCILKQPIPSNLNASNSNVISSDVTMCEKQTRDLPLSLIFNAVLLLCFFLSSVASLCKKDHHVTGKKRCSVLSVMSLMTSTVVILLGAAWATMVTYGNQRLGRSDEWFDPATAIFMVAGGFLVLLFIFPPVFCAMRELRSSDDDSGMYGTSRYNSEKYESESSLPVSHHYATSMERLQSFRSASGENAIAMSHIQPTPAKRNGVNNNLDRLRAPPGGRLNPTLELTEEDIWRERALHL